MFLAVGSILLGLCMSRVLGYGDGVWLIVGWTYVGVVIGKYIVSRIAIPYLRPFYAEFIARELKSMDCN